MPPAVCLMLSGYRSGILNPKAARLMTQTFPTSAQVIYQTLSADATFTNLLGTYNFKSTTEAQAALSIVSAGQDMPSIRNVQGVECIIQDAGDAVSQDYLTDDPYIVTTWSLFLIWD